MSGLVLPGDARIGVKPVRYRSLIQGHGAVSAWPLDEPAGASAVDDAFAANNGTPTNVTFGSSPLISGHTSGDFNGSSSFVTVADHASLDFTTDMSAEAWINWDGGAGFDAILSKWTSAQFGFILGIDAATSKLTFYLNASGSGIVAVVGATTLVAGTLYHVVGTFTGTSHLCYVNGVQDGSRSTTGPISTGAAPVDIGRHDTGADYYNGRIAWPALYNRALAATEIQMHYVAGLRKRKLGLAA